MLLSPAHARLVMAAALAALPCVGLAALQTSNPWDYSSHRVSCDFPVRLSQDCSIWQGATRPIAIGDYRMSLAGGADGRTVLVTRLRARPMHNLGALPDAALEVPRQPSVLEIADHIDQTLQAHGIRLENLQPVRRGGHIEGLYLVFSANAYDVLKRYTVLESEHWMPADRVRP